jgi:hypothetical protein
VSPSQAHGSQVLQGKERIMNNRLLPLLVAALALCVFAAVPLLAADKGDTKSHEGKFVRAEGNKLDMVDRDGKNEHTHTLSADAVITCNGKKCQVTDLKKGMFIKVTTRDNGKVAVRVDAKKDKGGSK